MNDKQILDNKPDGATHVEILASTKVYYLRKDKNGMGYDVFISNEWVAMNVTGYFRSLSDITQIVELEKALERQTKKVKLLEPLLVCNEQQRIAELEKELNKMKDVAIESAYLAILRSSDDKLEDLRYLDNQSYSAIRHHEMVFKKMAKCEAHKIVSEQLRQQAKG